MTTSGSLEQLDFTCADTTQTGSKRKAQAIFSRLSDSSGYIYITVNVTDSERATQESRLSSIFRHERFQPFGEEIRRER